MPKLSPFQKKNIGKLKNQAIKLYKQGLTVRQVAPKVGKSHAWVGRVVKHLST